MKKVILKNPPVDAKAIAERVGCSLMSVYNALKYKRKNSLLHHRIRRIAIESYGAQEVEFPDD